MKILVTGGTGLVGKNLQDISVTNTKFEFIFLSSKDCDLCDFKQTYAIFDKIKPNYVIHLAAYVGGLFKNMNENINMYEKNTLINLNVLKCSHIFNVTKLVSCLSTCIFPDKTTYPINETMLHNGPPHASNSGYAYAKRMLEIQSKLYQEQYNKDFICVIPTNIYGKYDNYNLTDGHVIPALIHKCFIAKINNTKFLIKGTGNPLRQFIYAEDLAKLLLWVLESYKKRDTIILSVSEKEEVSIKYVANLIAKCYNYENMIEFDSNYSDGQYKKTADNSKLMNLNPNFEFTSIDSGIKNTIIWFNKNYQNCRK
tara:strand:- start:34 stop:969 length:936 start_codon:yes stop_codon:yes gene_type:complete